ncbi:MAG: hypothetical protein JRI72_06355 [Deltaproteobacteria bacterium]|nr:hypothetical protein [Deltaproteobacteria bacterium]
MSKVILFETYSVLQAIFLCRIIRKACLLYFYGRGHSRLDFIPLKKRIVLKIVRLISPGIEIRQISQDMMSAFVWATNMESVSIVDKLEQQIKRSHLYKLAFNLLGDESIVKYYKMRLAPFISTKYLFWKIAKNLEQKHYDLYIAPSGEGLYDLDETWKGTISIKQPNILNLAIINRVRLFLKKSIFIAVLTCYPLLFVIMRLNKLSFLKNKKRRYDVRLPVIWGFNDEGEKIDGIKRPHNDGYLYNEKLVPGSIIHVFGSWKFSPEVATNYKRNMNNRGISWVDKRDYSLDIFCLKRLLRYYQKILIGLFKYKLYWVEPNYLIDITNRIIYHIFAKELEMANIDYHVEFIRDDYNAKHVVDTILCNQRKKKQWGFSMPPYLIYPHNYAMCI